MPFDLNSIAQANPTEQYTIDFSNEDFSDSNKLKNLRKALTPFQKLKFNLAKDITPQNKTAFIDFTINFFLKSNPKVIAFDLSGNQFSVDSPRTQQSTTERGRGTGRLARGGKGLRKISYATDANTFDDLLKNLLSNPTLKELNLQNNFLFLETAWIDKIRSAIIRVYSKIDLRNTHHEDEHFTAEQLYKLIKPFNKEEKNQPFAVITTPKPSCEILASVKELPDNLQKKINAEQEWVNLTEITDSIFNAYKEECFNQKIELIRQNSPSNTAITFPFPINKLTEEETQRLGEALKQNSTIETLDLPICHLPSLVPVIKDHASIRRIKVSALGHDDQLLNSLKEIFATNSKIQRLICDYRLILQDDFKNVTEAVLNNSQSGLKRKNEDSHNNKYIELEDTDGKLSSDPTVLKNLINKVKAQPADIRIIIDLSVLKYGLEHELCKKELIPWSKESGYPCDYPAKKLKKLEEPLMFFQKHTKLILTSSYGTHSEVINYIVSHLEEKEKEIEEAAAESDDEPDQTSNNNSRTSNFIKGELKVPLDLNSIAQANPTELYTIHFSNKDFSDSNELKKLETALNSFQKLKFKLAEDITPENKTTFIQFAIDFLASNPKVITLDLSDNQFSVDGPPPQPAKKQERNFLKEAQAVKNGTGKNQPSPKNFGDLLKILLASSFLKEINLRNNIWSSRSSWINNIRTAMIRGYTKIDLRNTCHEDELFTAEQLYTLIKPFTKDEKEKAFAVITTPKPSCEILASVKELPDNLQKKINAEQEWVNLTEITDSIFNAYKEECFNQKIEFINQNSPLNTVITFPFPINELTEKETQRLGEALKKNSTATSLGLPICHLPSLVSVIKNHVSILYIKVFALGYDDQLLNSLKEIFSTNSKIQTLICDYRVILQDDFKNVIEAVLNNPQSDLKRKNKDEHKNKYIELEDTNGKLSSDPTALKNLINKAKIQPADIRIVIDLSVLKYGLEHELCKKELLPLSTDSGVPCDYSDEERKKLEAPLLFPGGRPKLILTSSYDTHANIIKCIISHLEKKEKEIEEAEIDNESDQINIEEEQEKRQEAEQKQEPENTPATSSTSNTNDTKNVTTANHPISENIIIQPSSPNTNEHHGNLSTVEKNDPPLKIESVNLQTDANKLLPDFKPPMNADQKSLEELRSELDALRKQFKQVLSMARGAQKSAEFFDSYFNIDYFLQPQKKQFFEWNQKYQMLLKKAISLGVLNQDFVTKYQNYTEKEWDNDPLWATVKSYYDQHDEYGEQIDVLGYQLYTLQENQKERNDNYWIASLITCFTIVIPFIILLIYLIDNYLVTMPEVQSLQKDQNNLKTLDSEQESKLKTDLNPTQREFYYQTARLTKPFFAPLKEAAKEEQKDLSFSSTYSLKNNSG